MSAARAARHLPQQSARRIHQGARTGFPGDRAPRWARTISGSSRSEFLHAHPSRSGNLHHIGAPFAPFLAQRFAGTQYAYFADVAALEWAYQEALACRGCRTRCPPRRFADIDACRLRAPDVRVSSGVRASCSRATPIVRIWRANQPETLSDEVIDLACGRRQRARRCARRNAWSSIACRSRSFALFEALGSRPRHLGAALDRAQALAGGLRSRRRASPPHQSAVQRCVPCARRLQLR